MTRGRRVGTFTLGLVLIAVGVAFIAGVFFDATAYNLLLMLWPAALILLGVEVLVCWALNRPERILLDGAAIVIMLVLMLFAFGVGVFQLALQRWGLA